MKTHVVLIHGWGGKPSDGWFPWLKKELESASYAVWAPQMPHANHPRIDPWLRTIQTSVDGPLDQNIFVGHSLGCQAIVRYLAQYNKNERAKGAVFVAGFFKRLTGLDDSKNTKDTFSHWLSTPVHLDAAADRLQRSIAVFSNNDPYVPLDNMVDFKESLKSEIRVEKQMGHFSGDLDATFELPLVLNAIREMTS